DLKTAVAEACTNAIEHGNQLDASTKVGVTLTIDASSLQVAVQDQGPGIGTVETPDLDAKVDGEAPPRGWGMFLISRLMDDVQVESSKEGGNVVKMIIHLGR